jgi:hypothetical protein
VNLNGLKLYHAEDDGQLTVTIIYNISEVEHHLLLQKYSHCNYRLTNVNRYQLSN